MKKYGFATSAILYTMLLLFIVLLVSILNNLQNKKVILDVLKEDTINALQSDMVTDAILEQITNINNQIATIETQISELKNMPKLEERFHKIYSIQNITTSTDLVYSGVNVTMPANSYFCIVAQAMYNFGQPSMILITTSPDYYPSSVASGTQAVHASATYCGYAASDTPFYIWTQYTNVSPNDIIVDGFYVSM